MMSKRKDMQIIEDMADVLHELYDYIARVNQAEHKRDKLLDKLASFKEQVSTLKKEVSNDE
jgi:hypothetical protein